MPPPYAGEVYAIQPLLPRYFLAIVAAAEWRVLIRHIRGGRPPHSMRFSIRLQSVATRHTKAEIAPAPSYAVVDARCDDALRRIRMMPITRRYAYATPPPARCRRSGLLPIRRYLFRYSSCHVTRLHIRRYAYSGADALFSPWRYLIRCFMSVEMDVEIPLRRYAYRRQYCHGYAMATAAD